MASFAEVPPHTMASDFTLYPYQESWNQDSAYLPDSTYAEPSFTQAPFDAYLQSQQQAFGQSDQFAFGTAHGYEQQHSQHAIQNRHQPQQQSQIQQSSKGKSSFHAPSQHDSPANSASHSVEYSNLPVLSSTSDSGASVQSSISSAIGSPAAQPQFTVHDWTAQSHLGLLPEIVPPESLTHEFYATTTGYELESMYSTDNKGCVDPSLIQPTYSPAPFTNAQFPEIHSVSSPHAPTHFSAVPSPAPSRTSIHSPRQANGKLTTSPSPYMHTQNWQPYPTFSTSRRHSVSSVRSRHSQNSQSSEDSNKGLCPIATCGRHVKDLKAHMLTHQNERPEKCPIPTCEYHTKGFARKYDKNRHTLTHYKGTMVCGFCPGSGSAAEKSFNRADVFKRHLTSVHGVEQTPPNARKKSSPGGSGTGANTKLGGNTATFATSHTDVSGMCSTCGITFASAQEFYEHLDDCVLRVVQQADPSEAINEKLLSALAEDPSVRATMEKHLLPTSVDYTAPTTFAEDDFAELDDENGDEGTADDMDDASHHTSSRSAQKSRRSAASGNQSAHQRAASAQHAGVGNKQRRGLTYSKNGVPLSTSTSITGSHGPAVASKAPKRRRNYPLSWGAAPDKMKMKKRVLCVYDGRRRLWKDDMMLDAEHEVRIPLPVTDCMPGLEGNRRPWVTDLDMATLQRAEGVFGATEEERGPWIDPDLESEM